MNDPVYQHAYQLGVELLNNIHYTPNPAVMFDIDDTLLYVPNTPRVSKLISILPMINLLNYALSRGCMIIIITARDSRGIAHTIKELKEHSIHYHKLHLRKSPQENHMMFKSNIKEHYKLHGINIVMSIGDNEIDIIGPCSGYCIKLPNKTDPRLFYGK